MLSNYIEKVKSDHNVSYRELAKRMDISYNIIMKIKNETIKNISLPVLEKIALFENRNPLIVLYDILYKDDETKLLKNHSKNSLMFLCYLYLQNYSIDLNYKSPIHVFNKNVQFEGSAYQKRSLNNQLLIDSWDSLVKEYQTMFSNKNESIKDLFSSDFDYHTNVFSYASSKFMYCAFPEFRFYYIIIEDDAVYETVKYLAFNSASLHIIPLLIHTEHDLYNLKIANL